LFDRALAVVQEEMSSRHGVFGYIAEPGHLICPSLSKMLAECEIEGKCIHYPPEKWKGLWARALTEKRSIYTNDAPPVPRGHPIIHNNLAAPILFQGEAIGLLNLANKEDGYSDEDRDTLDTIAARVAPVLYAWIQRKLREDERRKAEETLRQLNEELEQRVAERTADLSKANVALGQAGAYNRSLLEASLDPLVTIGPDGRITDVNRATEEVTGCLRAELIGSDFSRYFMEPEKADEGYRKVFREGSVQDYPLEIRHRDGGVTSVLYNATVYRDETGEVAGVFAAARDVTGLRRAEQAVRAERQRFNDVLETLPAYLVLLTPDYHVPFANRFFRERFGESHGKRCFEYLFNRTEPCEVCDTYKTFKTNAPQRWEWTGPDGHIYDIYDFPFTDTDGSPLIMEMGIDITERKQAETALKQANETLEQRVAARTVALQEANEHLAEQSEVLQALNEELNAQTEELAAQAEELRTTNEELRQHEQALLRAKEQWERTFHSVPDLITILDDDHHVVQANRAMAERLGVTPEQCVGLICYKAIHGTDAPPSFCPHTLTLEDGCEHVAEVHEDRLGGDFLVSTTPLHDEHGQMIGSVHVARDITARKQMEEQLRRLNDQLEEEIQAQTKELRDTIDRLQDEVVRRVLTDGKLRKSSQMLEGFFQHTITPLAFMDRRFTFIRVNEAYAKAEGRSPEFFKGRNYFEQYPHEENKAIFEQVVQSGRPYRALAKPLRYPDDPTQVSYWDWRLTPLRNDRGDVQYLVLNLQDVTPQQAALRELENRASQLQKLALELSQAEDRERRRMAEVLHDGLQQQLAAAKFHLGLLSSRAKTDQAMCEIATQLDQMLRDAIEQSRSLSHELSPAVLYQSDLGETFEWLGRQVQAKHGLTVHTEVHGRVDAQSESIKTFLFRTCQEILFNAVKHAKVNEARLRLQRKREHLWLTIADRGQGFDTRGLARTTGFGLLSIRERVGLLGGRMKIRSMPGKGSVFLIAVPDAQIAEDREQWTQDGERKTESRRAERPSSSGPRPPVLRVLLVDDHKVMREGLAALIAEQKDMEIIGQAGDGNEAVERARELQPDVIIMDVAMPLMPGDEATRRIKAELPQTRVVALSMFAEPGVREKMLDAGAEIYLPKTGPSEELLAAIRGLDV
jgi:PAS domain S-box-containing protein